MWLRTLHIIFGLLVRFIKFHHNFLRTSYKLGGMGEISSKHNCIYAEPNSNFLFSSFSNNSHAFYRKSSPLLENFEFFTYNFSTYHLMIVIATKYGMYVFTISIKSNSKCLTLISFSFYWADVAINAHQPLNFFL
jgi:hypothetical protein